MPSITSSLASTAATSALAGERPSSGWDMLSLGVYALMVALILALLMFLAGWVGRRNPYKDKDIPYESGVVPSMQARLRMPVHFYLIAIFFIIFDLESVFVYSWAVAFDLLGWDGFVYITFFIGALFAGLAYIWKKKGLEWGPGGR